MRKSLARLLTLLPLFITALTANAQIHDRLHWVFPVDSVERITFDLVDPFTVETWAGNQIMVTSEITVYNATKGIMKFFIEENRRWDVIDTVQNNVLLLDSYHSRRAPIQSGGEVCYEVVNVKVFVPTEYEKLPEEEVWIRKENPPTEKE